MGERRPIATRELALSRRIAARLAAAGWTPNRISMAGMIAGLLAGLCFWLTATLPDFARPLLLLGALLVQLRLLCNMFDGMVALETDQASPVGELYNEVPDRVSDAAALVGLGYAIGGSATVGWAAAIAAVFTAYVRAELKVAGAPQDFCGPMAKPQRMCLVTVAALYCAVTPLAWQPMTESGHGIPALCLLSILIGSLWTALRRLSRGSRALRA
ncbi:MAG: CDP-alcohol phosphatidyltransferase family protein [Planctomycetota bacterium]